MNRACLFVVMQAMILCGCGGEEVTPADTIPGPDTVSSADGQTTAQDTAVEADMTSEPDVATEPDVAAEPDVAVEPDIASEPDTACIPDCGANACGDDGCGGSCGECEQGSVCDDVGQCGCPEGQIARCDLALVYDEGEGVTPTLAECVDASLLGDGTCEVELSCHEGDGGDCCPGQVDAGWLHSCFVQTLEVSSETPAAQAACDFPPGATIRACDGEACLPLDTWGDGVCEQAMNCLGLQHDRQDCKTYCKGEPHETNPAKGMCITQCVLEGKDPWACWIDEGECTGFDNEHGTCAPSGALMSCDGIELCPDGQTCGYEDVDDTPDALCVGVCGDGLCSGWAEWQSGSQSLGVPPCLEDCDPCAEPDDPTYIQDAAWSVNCADECVNTSALLGNGACDDSLNCAELAFDGGDCEPPTLSLAEQIQALLVDELGLEQLTNSVDVTEIELQGASYPGPTDFMTALAAAMTSFLTDDDDLESPLGIASFVAEATWEPDNPEGQTFAEATLAALIEHLNRPTASISLVPIGQTAEHGESVVDNWVFFLTIDELSDHLYWAIVDRQGVNGTYNYGFN